MRQLHAYGVCTRTPSPAAVRMVVSALASPLPPCHRYTVPRTSYLVLGAARFVGGGKGERTDGTSELARGRGRGGVGGCPYLHVAG